MAKSIPSKPKKAKIFSILLLLVVAGGGVAWFFKEKNAKDGLVEKAVVLERFQEEKPLMGTLASLIVYAESPSKAKLAFAAAFARAAEINEVASDYFPDSELSRFNASDANVWVSASDDLLTMVAYGLELADLTDGAYDPTLGTMTHLWRETKAAGRLPSHESLDQVQELSGWKLLELDLKEGRMRKLKAGVRLDLGGLGKGYAVDMMLQELQNHQISSALITIGGDVRCGEAPPGETGWTVGLNDYQDEVTVTMTISNCAVSTSGDLQQFVEIEGRRYSHIIDPATGLGTTDSLLATVVAPNGLMADPLATAACVDPTFFSEVLPSTRIHSRILSKNSQQLSLGFPILVPAEVGNSLAN